MITWIDASKEQPKQKDRVTDEGDPYKSSDMVLLWTTNVINPLARGCYEDDKWFIEGCNNGLHNVLYWAFINKPDGHLYDAEFDAC